jgi:hypothetical protein
MSEEPSSLLFLIGLIVVALFIFVLTTIQYVIQQRNGNYSTGPEKSEGNAYSRQPQAPPEERTDSIRSSLIRRLDGIIESINAYHNKRDSYEHARTRSEKKTINALKLTAGFSLAAFLAAIGADVIASRQLSEFTNQLALDHPAQISIRNIEIWPTAGKPGDPVVFAPRVVIDGVSPLVNVGRYEAQIEAMWWQVLWTSGPLPMHRPWFDDVPNQCGEFGRAPTPTTFHPIIRRYHGILGVPLTLKPGYGAHWRFNTIVPEDYTVTLKLHVWGGMRYRDQASEHSYVFARHYDLEKRKFIPEDDPDYDEEYLQQNKSRSE